VSEDYLSLVVRSRPGEDEAAFKTRLSEFWTGMLRNHPDEFEKVYAETVRFEADGDQRTRKYLFEASVADLLEEKLSAAALDHEPIDRDDVYSKYEATPPDWMWIEH
jgi:hypothetical protein